MVHAMFALAEHLHASAYSIGFPEMPISIVLALRAAAKKSKIGAFQVRVSPHPDPDPNPNPNPNPYPNPNPNQGYLFNGRKTGATLGGLLQLNMCQERAQAIDLCFEDQDQNPVTMRRARIQLLDIDMAPASGMKVRIRV